MGSDRVVKSPVGFGYIPVAARKPSASARAEADALFGPGVVPDGALKLPSMFAPDTGRRKEPWDFDGDFHLNLDYIREQMFALQEQATLDAVLAWLRERGYTVVEPTSSNSEGAPE